MNPFRLVRLKMNSRSASTWGLLAIILTIGLCLQYQIQNLPVQDINLKSSSNERRYDVHDAVPISVKDGSSSMPPVVLYNRVPKTGSTSFTNLIYKFAITNKMYVIHINTTKNSHIMSLQDQRQFVMNITNWNDHKPAFYHGHMSYIDFKKFGSPLSPLYINIIRQPLDRLVSYYYFLRYGDDYRKGLSRAKQGDKTTFDECVVKKGHDCQPEMLWMQIPFFCGQAAECWKAGSEWALAQAKYNLVSNYMLVGMTERMEEFVVILEAVIPELFHGITQEFQKGNSHIRSTLHKEAPSDETVASFKRTRIWQLEQEFYDFAVQQFDFIKEKSTFVDNDGKLQPIQKNFRYEKVRGTN